MRLRTNSTDRVEGVGWLPRTFPRLGSARVGRVIPTWTQADEGIE